MIDHDLQYMRIALDLAQKGRRYTSPNPMVGAVVVKNHQVVGKGFHEFVGGPHAEVNAIDDAGDQARDATLYVTLEPCNHYGRTPPCTQKIISSGIRKVVSAMNDPNPTVTGGGNAFLMANGIPVVQGVGEDQARQLNEAYIKYVTEKKPFVTLKCAATLDGRIATAAGDARWISNDLSRQCVHRLRHENDGILVGVDTVKTDNPRLTTRLPGMISGKKPRNPLRIILDTRLTVPEDAAVLHVDSESDTLIATGLLSDPKSADKKERLSKKGIQILELPLGSAGIDLNALMLRLAEMKITSLLIEGGSRVLASALSEKIADKVMFFYAPKLLAADDGTPICSGIGPRQMADCIAVERIRVRQFGNDVLIEGYIKK